MSTISDPALYFKLNSDEIIVQGIRCYVTAGPVITDKPNSAVTKNSACKGALVIDAIAISLTRLNTTSMNHFGDVTQNFDFL